MNSQALQRCALRRGGPQLVFGRVHTTKVHHVDARFASSIPTIAQPSFWKSLVPKPFRRQKPLAPDAAALRIPKKKDWNPATFFIVIFLLIGSMSIQLIVLKRDFATFMRKSDVTVGLLKEVVERIQKGEKVDVEKVLGTGNTEKELEWEDVLRDIEVDSASRRQKKEGKKAETATPTKFQSWLPSGGTTRSEEPPTEKSKRPPSFF